MNEQLSLVECHRSKEHAKRGNWLQCFSHAHILALNQPLEMLTWVELLPRLLVLLPLVLTVLVLLPLLSSSLQQH